MIGNINMHLMEYMMTFMIMMEIQRIRNPPVLSGRRRRRRGQRPVGRLLRLVALPGGQLWRLRRLCRRHLGLSDLIATWRL